MGAATLHYPLMALGNTSSPNSIINTVQDNRINVISPDSRATTNQVANDNLGNYPIANHGVDMLIPLSMTHGQGLVWFDIQLSNARFFLDSRTTNSGRQLLQVGQQMVHPEDWPTFNPIVPPTEPEFPGGGGDGGNNNGGGGNVTNPDTSQYNITVNNTPALILGENIQRQQGAGRFVTGDNVVIYPGVRPGFTFSHWSLIPRERVFIAQFGFVDINGIRVSDALTRFDMPPVELELTAHWTPNAGTPFTHTQSGGGSLVGSSLMSAVNLASLLGAWDDGWSSTNPTPTPTQAPASTQAPAERSPAPEPITPNNVIWDNNRPENSPNWQHHTPGFVIDPMDTWNYQHMVGRTISHQGTGNEVSFALTVLSNNTIRVTFDTSDVVHPGMFLRVPMVMQRTHTGHIHANITTRSPNLPITFNSNGYRLSGDTQGSGNNNQDAGNVERTSGVVTLAGGRAEIAPATRRAGHYTLDVRNAQGVSFRLRDVESNTFTLQNNAVSIAAVRVDGIVYSNVVGAYVPEYLSWNNNGRAVTIRDVEDAEVVFYLSAHPSFAGHVDMTWQGSADGRTRVATVIPAFDVVTETTVLEQGGTNQAIRNLVIEENVPGALSGLLTLELDELTLQPNWTVTANNGMDIRREGATGLRVFNRSSRTPATITLSGLTTNVPTQAVTGYRGLTLSGFVDNANSVLNGDVRANQQGFHRFAFDVDTDMVVNDFIRIAPAAIEAPPTQTPPEETPQEQGLHVIVSENRPFATVNGQQVSLTTGDYAGATLTPALLHNSRLYVPVRALSLIFGDNVRVNWHSHTATAEIVMNGVTVTFTEGSNTYTVNGQARQMDAAAFISTQQFSTNAQSWGRMYVPFRFFGYAFGFDVSWDSQRGEAHFNHTGSIFNVRRVN